MSLQYFFSFLRFSTGCRWSPDCRWLAFEMPFACLNTRFEWEKASLDQMLPISSLNSSSSSLPPLIFFPPSTHTPPHTPPPLFADALSALVCLGCNCEGSPLALFSHVEHWACVRLYVCVKKRERRSTHSCMGDYMNECACVCVCVWMQERQKKRCLSVWIYPNVCAVEPECLSHCVCFKVFECVSLSMRMCVCVCVCLASSVPGLSNESVRHC